MKVWHLLLGLGVFALGSAGAGARAQSASSVVVLLREGEPREVASRHGLVPREFYVHALRGFAGCFSAEEQAQLAADPAVEFIEAEQVLRACSLPTQPALARIGWAESPSVTAAAALRLRLNVDLALLDTGIDARHRALRVHRSVNCVDPARAGTDDNGHGTHGAGIAAAMNDGRGPAGVAPGARLWSVKVLGADGQGALSAVLAGLDYVAANAESIEVAGLGFISERGSPALARALAGVTARGVVCVAPAGNAQRDVADLLPASSPDVLCVSAAVDTDGRVGGRGRATRFGPDDSRASFSNYGAAVRLAAPGVDIFSTSKGGGYATISGTSAAAAHVAGAVALFLATHPKPTDAAGVAMVREQVIAAAQPQWQHDSARFAQSQSPAVEPLVDVRSFGAPERPGRLTNR